MNKFYGNLGFITCGNGCNAKIQAVLYDENNKAYDIDREELMRLYDIHRSNCSIEIPFVDDPNSYYGNPDDCTGFIENDNPDSGYKYCEY